MKMTFLLLLATLAVPISTAIAEQGYSDEVSADEAASGEASNSSAYYTKYCSELAGQSGIESDEELKQFVSDCLESYIGPAGE